MKPLILYLILISAVINSGCDKRQTIKAQDSSHSSVKEIEKINYNRYTFTDRKSARTYELPLSFSADFRNNSVYEISQSINADEDSKFTERVECDLSKGYVLHFHPQESLFLIGYWNGFDVLNYNGDFKETNSKRHSGKAVESEIRKYPFFEKEYYKRFSDQ